MVRLFGYFCCALFLLITSLSCDSTEPPAGSGAKLTLAVEDSSCTEVWLKLTTANLPLPVEITLKQNDIVAQTISLCCEDTLLYIDELSPKQTYKFKAVLTDYQQPTSNEVTTKTMDTTSHNFSWQSWTFGEHSSSVLYDVAIIDENNIWAVGEIYMNDSLGNPDPKRYNAAIWNGTEWEIKRIPYNYQGTDFINPIQSVFAFGQNDIWFCGNGIIHWDGSNYIPVSIPTNVWGSFQMNKLWGTSSEDLYVVGDGGNIAHYENGVWIKIESGTEVDLLDVWGSPDGSVVWICGEEDFKPTVLLKYSSNTLEKVIEDTENLFNYNDSIISGGIHSIWTNDNKKLFVQTWFDLYRTPTNTKGEAKALWKGNPSAWGVESLRANDINDLIAAGVYSRIWHFNGVSWKRYENVIDQKDILYEIEIKGNIAVSVGHRYYNGVENFGLIHLGKR